VPGGKPRMKRFLFVIFLSCLVPALAGCAQIAASRRVTDRAPSDGPVSVGQAFSQAAGQTSLAKAEPSMEGDELFAGCCSVMFYPEPLSLSHKSERTSTLW
jgi:hypothetical protein